MQDRILSKFNINFISFICKKKKKSLIQKTCKSKVKKNVRNKNIKLKKIVFYEFLDFRDEHIAQGVELIHEIQCVQFSII